MNIIHRLIARRINSPTCWMCELQRHPLNGACHSSYVCPKCHADANTARIAANTAELTIAILKDRAILRRCDLP